MGNCQVSQTKMLHVPSEGTKKNKNKNDANGDYKKMNNNFLYLFFF
jgi:hypothetical protein